MDKITPEKTKGLVSAASVIIAALSAACLMSCSPGAKITEEQEIAPSVITVEDTRDQLQEAETAAADADADADLTENEEETVPEETVPDPADSFYAEEISDAIFARMAGKSFPDECTTPREDLRYLHLLYKDIDGRAHEGEMVCNEIIADKLIDIFRKLYEADYPIERMSLVDDYDADDDASMLDNNTSCFNFRYVSGTNSISKHGLGLAVDLNPFYNPYIHVLDGVKLIEPEGSEPYADRSLDFDYKIDEDDLAYRLFKEAGFTWGGSWKNSKDYQHFQYVP